MIIMVSLNFYGHASLSWWCSGPQTFWTSFLDDLLYILVWLEIISNGDFYVCCTSHLAWRKFHFVTFKLWRWFFCTLPFRSQLDIFGLAFVWFVGSSLLYFLVWLEILSNDDFFVCYFSFGLNKFYFVTFKLMEMILFSHSHLVINYIELKVNIFK